jgi:hypothetical protein
VRQLTVNGLLFGVSGGVMFCAHIAPVVEPLLFGPAFVAVGWALAKAWRSPPPPRKENP